MQALGFIESPVEAHLPFLVKMKKILATRPSHACVETRVSHVRAGMVCERKTMMMVTVLPKHACNNLFIYHIL